MKKYTIRKFNHTDVDATRVEAIGSERMEVTDGYHTMDELYDHRITLWIALCKFISISDLHFPYVTDGEEDQSQTVKAWRSKLHSDGSEFEGWFILGIGKEKGQQITYHLPIAKWEATEFADTLEKAPEWDGHSSSDVLDRLAKL